MTAPLDRILDDLADLVTRRADPDQFIELDLGRAVPEDFLANFDRYPTVLPRWPLSSANALAVCISTRDITDNDSAAVVATTTDSFEFLFRVLNTPPVAQAVMLLYFTIPQSVVRDYGLRLVD